MSFTKNPRSIGNLSLLAGTKKIDRITGLGGTAVFSGDGNDILTGRGKTSGGWILPSILVGGNGNDNYIVGYGSFTIISDQGNGKDTVDLSALDSDSTYFVKLNRGVIGITDGNTIVAIDKPFKGNKTKIENVIFAGKTWTPQSLYNHGVKMGASLGTMTFAMLEDQGYLNFSVAGLSSSDSGIASVISALASNSQIVA